MSEAAPAAPETLCPSPSCGAANRAGTRFCASCGTPLSAGGDSPAHVPPPPAPPHLPFPGTGPQPLTDRALELPLAPDDMVERVASAVQAMGGELTRHSPVSLSANLSWPGLGKPVRFRCQMVVLSAGPGASRLAYGIKPDWSSTFLVLGILGGVGLFNLFFLTAMGGVLVPLLSAAAIGWAFYDYAVAIPNKLAARLQKQLSAQGQPAPVQPAQAQPAQVQPAPANNVTPMPNLRPVPAPAPESAPASAPESAPVTAPASASAAAEDDIIHKIEKLAGLRDRGLIDAAEFERRRADLLDRL